MWLLKWFFIQVLIVLLAFTRVCPHFKNGDENEINYRQTRKTA